MNEISGESKAIKCTFWFIGIVLTFFIIKTRYIEDGGHGKMWIVETDGRGYYAHLPAILIYHDLNYDFIDVCEGSMIGMGGAQKFYLENGQRGNKYFVGEAVLLLPFFLVAYVISYFTLYDLSGYNDIFYGSVAIAALFYAFVAFVFIRKTLQLYGVKENRIVIILLLLVFGTNLFRYIVYEPSMSHIYSFAVFSVFIYFIKRFQIDRLGYHLLIAAIALGLITIIRPVNVMIVLGVPFLVGSFDGLIKLILDVYKSGKYLLIGILCYILIVFIQLFIYYKTSGNFFHWPYSGEGFDFRNPHFWDVLLSYRKGFFVYTPLMFVAILFIIPYFRKSVFASISFILFFVVITYVISCWKSWEYGGSFSMRPLLEYYPVLIIPMAVGLNEIRKLINVILLSILFLVLIAFCLLQTYQYQYHLLSYGEMNKEKYWKVFLKTDPRLRVVAYPPKVEIVNHDSIVLKRIFFNDFENPVGDKDGQFNTMEYFSGRQCIKVDKQFAFSPGFQSTSKELKNDSISYVEIRLMVKNFNFKNDVALIVSFEWPSTQVYRYDSYPLSLLGKNNNSWEKMTYSAKFPLMGDEDMLKIYVWNTSELPFYIDDFKVELYSKKR